MPKLNNGLKSKKRRKHFDYGQEAQNIYDSYMVKIDELLKKDGTKIGDIEILYAEIIKELDDLIIKMLKDHQRLPRE
ncbi:MAG: hypothetical protein LBT62_02560 [Deltaproteobacteria bacterium]|jgi:hypothetical protein|nr:hypothetical protein [Deltaproteobacteria bacterium]